MYFIGIDISKFKHDCAIIDEAGDTVTASWSFANNCEGFQNAGSRQYGLSIEERSNLAQTFLDELEAQGYTGMFYAAKNELAENSLWLTDELELKYRIWVARYGLTGAPTDESTPPLSPNTTLSFPSCAFSSATVVSMKEAALQSCFPPQMLTTKFFRSWVPSSLWNTSGWNCTPHTFSSFI